MDSHANRLIDSEDVSLAIVPFIGLDFQPKLSTELLRALFVNLNPGYSRGAFKIW
jgi:hypothetical protein